MKVLAEGGRNEDSHINRLYSYVDRMPVFGISYLLDAMRPKAKRVSVLTICVRRINNAILPEGGSAHVEELDDPYLLCSGTRTSAPPPSRSARSSRHGDDEQLVEADGALADAGAEEGPLGQHAGERLGHGVARRLLPQVRERDARLHRAS